MRWLRRILDKNLKMRHFTLLNIFSLSVSVNPEHFNSFSENLESNFGGNRTTKMDTLMMKNLNFVRMSVVTSDVANEWGNVGGVVRPPQAAEARGH